jgi:hypothetical protein
MYGMSILKRDIHITTPNSLENLLVEINTRKNRLFCHIFKLCRKLLFKINKVTLEMQAQKTQISVLEVKNSLVDEKKASFK